jgi:hypothetical protein
MVASGMRSFPVGVLAFAVCCSCSSGTGGSNASVASIAITPEAALLAVGDRQILTAEGLDAAGVLVADVTFTWTSSDPSIATVADGAVVALAVGTATLTANTGSVTSPGVPINVVTATPAGPSSEALINAARAAGAITDEQALIYRVFAIFNDPRLPAAYKGNDKEAFESSALREADNRFEQLSSETQDTLGPFLLRPADIGSWLNPVRKTKKRTRPTCRGESSGWTTINGTESVVDVWYDIRVPGQKEKAAVVWNAIQNESWPKLITALKLKAPLEDSSVFGCFGRTAKLDVYLVPNFGLKGLTNSEAWKFPLVEPPRSAATYIILKGTLDDRDLRAGAAHELMHAIQFAYPMLSPQDSYGWLRDATANWAIDHVYGKGDVQLETAYSDCYTLSTDLSLDDRVVGRCGKDKSIARDYGAYLFFQFLEKTSSAQTVKAVIEATQTKATSLEAVDANISGGFKEQWPKFAKTIWNKDPINTKPASFEKWDGLMDQPGRREVNGDLGTLSELTETLPDEQLNLSSRYYHFKFSDASARSLLFYNGFFDQIQAGKEIRVQAMWKDAAGTWHEEDDWGKYEYVGLCRDLKEQRATDLIIIVSSSEWIPAGGKITAAKAPYLKRSNMGCYKYEGTATATSKSASWVGLGKQAVSKLVFDLHPSQLTLPIEHPQIPNARRVGMHLSMGASGSYVFTESYTNGSCSFSAGPTPYTIVPPKGFLMLNTFPEIKHIDPTMKLWLMQKPRAYQALVTEVQTQLVTGAGPGCSNFTDFVGALIATNDAANGNAINPPVALPNGDLIATFPVTASTTMTWNLKAQLEP